MQNDEIWKAVSGYEGRYEVSNFGRVRGTPGCGQYGGLILKPWVSPKGYVLFSLRKMTFKAHRLVLSAFDRPPEPNEEGAHLDGNPGNNHLSNLEWKLPVANAADQRRHGTQQWGERHGASKLRNSDVETIRRLRSDGLPWKEIHRKFPQVSWSTIIEAGNGTSFRHLHGFISPSSRAVRVRQQRGLSPSG